MKKPKKITAAKPLSARAESDAPKTRAKSLKTESETPEKNAAKKARKPAKEPEQVAPPSVEIKATEEAKAPATKPAKRISKPKAVTETKPVLKQESAPASPHEPPGTAGVPPARAESLPPRRRRSQVPPAIEPAPPAVPVPAAKVKRAPKAKTLAVKPVAEVKPPAAPTPPVQPKPTAAQEAATVQAKPSAPLPAKAEPVSKPPTAVEAMPGAPAETASPTPKPASADPVQKIQKPAPRETIAEVKHASRSPRIVPSRIPPILLEGDKPGPVPASGPGERYALGPKPPVEKLKTEGELPASYGTGTILLTARDPHWLYTHWDLSDDQQRRYNAFSRDGHLVVRIYIEAAEGKPVAEIHVHPESRHWFVHVERANTRYLAQLGYYSAAERWTPVSTSAATLTPPDAVSTDTSADFSTIPFEVPMEKLLSLVKEAVQENPPLAQAMQELRAAGHEQLPEMPQPQPPRQPQQSPRSSANGRHSERRAAKRATWKPSHWTPAQERALAEVVSMDQVRRVWMGSLEITELIRRQFERELAPANAAELGAAAPTSPTGAITGISSPTKAAERGKGFWFNVNAELIVYGATERDATVTIGGRKIKLRRDGSFSYRFALPDGDYEMPVVAVSADETDGRAAQLEFRRHTEYRGDVGAHPQDPGLQKLLLENF